MDIGIFLKSHFGSMHQESYIFHILYLTIALLGIYPEETIKT